MSTGNGAGDRDGAPDDRPPDDRPPDDRPPDDRPPDDGSNAVSGDGHEDADERIESYLDELMVALRGRPRDARRLLAEVAEHLRESTEAGVAAGLDRPTAVARALDRFGPAAVVAHGLPLRAAYRALLGQVTEAALLLVSLLLLAVGVAAIPTAVLGIAGKPGLVTGDNPHAVVPLGRCQQLLHALWPTGTPAATGPTCSQALAVHHIEEVLRSHAAGGMAGLIVLVVWWVLHHNRRWRPSLLPAGFALTVCGTLLGTLAVPLVALGGYDITTGTNSTGGAVGSGDLVTTGVTVLVAALLCWLLLARQATRPAAGWGPRSA